MEAKNNSESRFYESLKGIFIGAKIEGFSGYINLMKIKSRYFDKIFILLKKEIEEKLKEFPEFKEELYYKLYSFFKRYFSESGSVYFVSTPFSERIYEKVYTDRKDVSLFWKTNMLYYVKTDRIFNSINIETDGFKFFFDVSKLEHKKAWEKREIIYELKEVRKDGTISFYVMYSERGRETKLNEIIKKLKEKGIKLDEEILEKAFRIFEKQSEVDYFITKNAKKFLKEQFDLWLYQYEFSDKSEFSEKRIKQLKVLQEIAYKIIDFISQFEDELVRIWNKPKFVLNSNYVVTLDRIAKKGIKVIEKILKHKNFEKQVKEWKDLGIVDENFKTEDFFTNTLDGKTLNSKYNFLPIDTKYFKDLELEILSLFDNLDEALDGWLIKSENYQALNTILPKFKEKIQTIYIDPPFNKEQDADYFYNVKFKDATWITILENRLRLVKEKELLNEKGSIFVRCDYNGNMYVRLLMNEIFGEENFRNEIVVNRTQEFFKYAKGLNKFMVDIDTLFFYAKTDKALFNEIRIKREIEKWWEPFLPGKGRREEDKYRIIFGKKIEAPEGRIWGLKQEQIKELENSGRIKIEKEKILYAPLWTTLKNNWTDIPGYSRSWGFITENSEILLKRVIESTSNEGDLVMDFFLGSGTTTAVAHKLKRKWIGIEMGEHFYTVVLPRMKKVLAYDKTGISKEKDVKEKYNENNAGGFFKYFELEQFEQTLRNVKYQDSDPFLAPGEDPYNQYIFMKDLKLLEALEVDYEKNKVKVDLSKLYKNIDIAETLSCFLGKWIKRISVDEVEFEDGEKVNLKDLDYKLVKPLIWWTA
ncbi:MAG: site-specific DNA-methyltransferase [Thermoplasmatales archaeon]|nr:site-specific DNA-methyltransferase [Thermoplasmatales archaeon]